MLSSRLNRMGIAFPFFVAPMVGVSHVAFRELIRSYTPRTLQPLLFTEMLSTRRLPNQCLYRDEILFCSPGERSFIPQLLGNEEQFIAPSIEKLMPLSPWGFDINMGCPQKKTLSHNWGVLLMGDKNYAAQVVSTTKRYSPRPVSVKLRAGAADTIDLDYLLEFTLALEDAGADWLTVHCRARGQKHSGEARWDMVGAVARQRAIPVVGNGDIQTADDAISLLRDYGADGAMIARGAMARPWILWQIAQKLGIAGDPPGREGERPPSTPEEEGREYFRALLRFSCLLQEYFGNSESALKRLKYYIVLSHRWLPFGHQFWKNTQGAKDLCEARDRINDCLENSSQPLCNRIQL